MEIHDIKIKPCYFKQIIKRNKMFEIRKDDLNYNVGDIVTLHEFDGEKKNRQTSNYFNYLCLKECKRIWFARWILYIFME